MLQHPVGLYCVTDQQAPPTASGTGHNISGITIDSITVTQSESSLPLLKKHYTKQWSDWVGCEEFGSLTSVSANNSGLPGGLAQPVNHGTGP